MYAMFLSSPVFAPRSTRTVSCARSDSPPTGDVQMTEVPETQVVCWHLVGPTYAIGRYTCPSGSTLLNGSGLHTLMADEAGRTQRSTRWEGRAGDGGLLSVPRSWCPRW